MRRARLLGAVLLAAFAVVAAPGVCLAQSESDLAKASQNPVANMTSFPLQFNYYTGGGLQSKTSLVVNVQPVMPLPIDKQWLLVSRTIVPYTNVPLPDNTRVTGIADIQEQMYFTPAKPERITWAFGPVLSIPTATNDVSRTGQWALGPTAVGLVMPGPWVIGVLGNNLWRIGGVNHGNQVNLLTVQPFINLNLPNAWSITTAPIITADWSAPDDQRWTVPLGIGIGKISTIGKQAVSIGIQYYHNAEHPTVAGSEQFRFVFALLYPIAKH